ncbi:MAG TPA: adenosine deaminase [Longimicrobiales bacterium]|nr:adenosine deaminase [Longimicrobiales bacterium]
MSEVTLERIRRLPKAELHVHLDGSLRPTTLIELAREQGHTLPTDEPHALAEYMYVRDARDLTDYLERFQITLAVMQTADALERITYELGEDAAAENVRWLEVRYSPALNIEGGLTMEEVVDATLRGARRAEADFGIRIGLILCGIRSMSSKVSRAVAEVAVAYRDRGVVALDLAGAELDHPPVEHQLAFDLAAEANLPVTIHAGEAFGPASIHQAVHRCHARRIGHGTRLYEDPELEAYVNDFRIPLEVCPTSNVQTRAVASYAEHPLRRYFDEGLVVTLNTDNRMMSGLTLSEEYLRCHQNLEFGWEELKELALMGFQAAFLPWAEKVALVEEMRTEMQGL